MATPAARDDDLYGILGVPRGASPEEVRRSYKRRALTEHPDKGGSQEAFQRLQRAAEVLMDDQRRALYDATGVVDEGAGGGGPPGPHMATPFPPDMGPGGFFHFMAGMGPGGMPGVAFHGNPFADLFGGDGGGPQPRGGPPGQRPRAPRGPDKHHDIAVPLRAFYAGHTFTVQFIQSRRCEECRGEGGEAAARCDACNGAGARVLMQQLGPGMFAQRHEVCGACAGRGKRVTKPCAPCAGRGYREREKTLTAEVKPGMRAGQTLVFAGECSEAPEYEAPGDVILHLQAAPGGAPPAEASNGAPAVACEPLTWRGGEELHTRVRVTFLQALAGFAASAGDHPRGTPLLFAHVGGKPLRHGAVLRVAGGGMPRHGGGGGHGDLLVQVLVAAATQEEAAAVLSAPPIAAAAAAARAAATTAAAATATGDDAAHPDPPFL